MKKALTIISALLTLCVAFDASAASKKEQKAEKVKMTSAGMKYIDANFTTYHNLSTEIHKYAETGYNEFRSVEAIIKHLEANGFKVEKGVAGIPTAFIATFGSGSPVVGILTEYDALPGLAQDTVPYRSVPKDSPKGSGHGCGHNFMGTASIAAGVSISKWLAEGHQGTVKVFGCPAEEGGGGKAYMVREGCFDGTDVALDWHSGFSNNANPSTGLANLRVRFEFSGVSSHAAVAPEKGRSALDAVEAFDFMINMMREHVPSDARIHYVITNGGAAPNVVPDKAEVLYYFRHSSRNVVQEIFDRALKAAEGAAMGTGTTLTYEIMNGNYEKLPNLTLSRTMYENMQKVGGMDLDERETAFAKELMKNSGVTDMDASFATMKTVTPFTGTVSNGSGSSDVGNVTWVVPCSSISYASFVPGCASLHSWQCTATGGTTISTKAALQVARIYYLTAYDIFNDPSKLEAIKTEFNERRGPDFKFVPLMGDRKPALDYNIETRY